MNGLLCGEEETISRYILDDGITRLMAKGKSLRTLSRFPPRLLAGLKNPMHFLRYVLAYLDSRLEISLEAQASGKGERLVICDWSKARESGDFIALAHIQRYEWVLPRVEGLECLDAGCGSGYGANFLAAHGVKCVIGVDVSKNAIRHAHIKYRLDSLDFEIMDVRRLALRDDCFETVISFDVMEHMKGMDQGLFCSELARILRVTGSAYIGCPNASRSQRLNPFHLGELTSKEFESLLRRHFREVTMLGQDVVLDGKRQRGYLDTTQSRPLNASNFIIEDDYEDSFGLLAICKNPFKIH